MHVMHKIAQRTSIEFKQDVITCGIQNLEKSNKNRNDYLYKLIGWHVRETVV